MKIINIFTVVGMTWFAGIEFLNVIHERPTSTSPLVVMLFWLGAILRLASMEISRIKPKSKKIKK